MGSSSPPQIRPPSVAQHLREFAARRDAWLILLRNMIPVIGIYFFGWSAALSVFNYWWDGFTALAAITAAMIPRAIRETQPKSGPRGPINAVFAGVFTWLFLVALIGMPYWIAMGALSDLLFSDELRQRLMHPSPLWLIFGGLAAAHFWKAFHLGYDTMPDTVLKQRVRWDVYLLILRAVAMFVMVAHGLAFVIVPAMALVLSYFEIWPERVLGAFFGDPARLSEYDPEDASRKRER